MRFQYPSLDAGSTSSFASTGAGLVIGGGATTRSAAYALNLLGLTPIFLVNRDEAEIKAIQSDLSHLDLIHLTTPEHVEAYLGGSNAVRIFMAVGAIRKCCRAACDRFQLTFSQLACIKPQTPSERMVYTTASAIFTMPYVLTTPSSLDVLPEPKRPIFLEMAVCFHSTRSTQLNDTLQYKPKITTMYKVASAHDWHVIGGIQVTFC